MNTPQTKRTHSSIQHDPRAAATHPHISVVIPVYNSSNILPALHHRLTAVLKQLNLTYEIIFVDDCSPDKAWNILEHIARSDARVRAFQLMRNSGQSSATLCGFAASRGTFVITMDDDLQHPPEEIPVLLNSLTPDLDVVMGTPYVRNHNFFRRLGSQLLHEVNSYLLGKERSLRFTSFRILRRPVVDGLLTMRTLTPALGPMISSITKRIKNVNVRHDPRHDGSSGYTVGRIASQTMSNLIGYSMLPLRLLAVFGAFGILCSLSLGIVFFVRYMIGGITVPGWTTIALMLAAISGFNFFAFAILGEYVLRILQRTNATPQYLIRKSTALPTGADFSERNTSPPIRTGNS